MAKVRLFHPKLNVEITVPAESAWVHLENGWQPVDDKPEPPPLHDPAGPPVAPTKSEGNRWGGKHAKE